VVDAGHAPQQAAAAPAPLVSFDTGGSASVISYQTPESTSYGGRHVLEITDYGLADFAGVTAPVGQAAAGQRALSSGPTASTPSAPSLSDSISTPRSVVLSDSTVGTNAVIAIAPFDQSDRMAALTWEDVKVAAAASKQLDVYRSIGGQLDYRIRDISQIKQATVQQGGSSGPVMAVAQKPAPNGGPGNGGGKGGAGGSTTTNQYIEVVINSPANTSTLSGPSNGINIPLMGTFISTVGAVTMHVDLLPAVGANVIKTVDAQFTETAASGGWTAQMPVAESGTWRLRAVAQNGSFTGADLALITVNLSGPPNQFPPGDAPSVWITSPMTNDVIPIPPAAAGNGSAAQARAVVAIQGGFNANGGSAVTVSIAVDSQAPQQVPAPEGGATAFTYKVLLSGAGPHTITATAVNNDNLQAPAWTVKVALVESAPFLPIDRRLILIEKIAITSFLGNFGAGRLVKTFSLLPGEQTTISVDSYTKDDATAKSASSILDSTATECGADFEDTVNNENDTKSANSDATSASVSAEIGSNWGWGNASIKAGYTDSANSSRENAVKTVNNALAKHTSKASSNRSVSVNTDFSQTTSTGTTTDTTRTLKNINVSRALNFVFRQMTQEYTAIVHLTDATLGYYGLDVLLGADDNPLIGSDGGIVTRETFTEYTLPEITDFMNTQMTAAANATPNLRDNVLNVLSSVPDYTGTLQSLVEQVTPKAPDGTPDQGATYLRVKTDIKQGYPADNPQYTVPGIILGASSYVLRTDQLLCDALLGEGDALDSYSHALQDVAIAERQAAVAETQAAVAREQLAQSIVSNKDTDMAAIWGKIFPQPLSVPATVTVPATPDGAAAFLAG
jgi:hypothetical protein